MLNARAAMRSYLDLIFPWASGSWDREVLKNPDLLAQWSSPRHIIFPIPSRPLPGFFEQLLLGPARSQQLMVLIAWVNRFNAALACYNDSSMLDRAEMAMIAHGVIGKRGSGTLHDAFLDAEASL